MYVYTIVYHEFNKHSIIVTFLEAPDNVPIIE